MVLRMGTGSMLYGGGSFVRYAAVRTHCPPGATAIAINTCMLGLSPKTPACWACPRKPLIQRRLKLTLVLLKTMEMGMERNGMGTVEMKVATEAAAQNDLVLVSTIGGPGHGAVGVSESFSLPLA